jgi:hypothetical protein
MPIDRADYTINIKTTSDVSAAKSANAALLELTKTAGETGKGLEKAGESAHELHEKFHLVKLAAGEALGELGELGKFITDPALFGVALAVVAVKSLVESLEKTAEQTRKNIEEGQAYRDFLVENHNRAVRDAAEETHRWNLELEHARDNVDRLGHALQSTVAVGQQNLANTNDLIAAEERLAEAITRRRQANGELTPGQATAEQQRIREQAQHARDAAEDAEKEGEIRDKRRTASGYVGEADVAESDLAGLNVGRQQNTEHLGRAANDIEEARKRSEEATAAANEAKAKLQSGPSPTEVTKAMGEGKSGADLAREFAEDAKQKDEKAKAAKITLEAAIDTQSHLTTEKQTIDASIQAAQELIRTRRDLVEKLKAEADAAEDSLHNHQQGRAQVEAVDRQTDEVNRRAANEDTVRRVQAGQGTPGEQSQVADWQAQAETAQQRGPQLGNDISDAIYRGQNVLQAVRAGGGRGDSQQMQEVHELLNSITGYLEGHSTQAQGQSGVLQDIRSRLSALEQRMDNNRWNP